MAQTIINSYTADEIAAMGGEISQKDEIFHNKDTGDLITGDGSTPIEDRPVTTPGFGQTPAQEIIVATEGGDFTSIKVACDSITDSGVLKGYAVKISPGNYTENPFTIPDNVELYGKNVGIVPIDDTSDFITVGYNSKIDGCNVVCPATAKAVLLSSNGATFSNGVVFGPGVCSIESGATNTLIRNSACSQATYGICIASGNCLMATVSILDSDFALQVSDNSTLEGSAISCADNCYIHLKTLGSNSKVTLTSTILDVSKLDVASYDYVYITANSIQEDDEALVVTSELQVGVAEKGREIVVGEGDSYTRGMLVYTETEANVFGDESAAAQSASGSTLSFPGLVADNCIYFASTLDDGSDVVKHFGIKTKISTACVPGSGEIVLEYWNGSSWVEHYGMESDATSPYLPHGRAYFEATGSHHIRYDNSISDRAKNDPMTIGIDYYWHRARIKTEITTSPIFEQIKLHPNKMDINPDGWLEFCGSSRFISTLPWSIDSAKPFSSSPGNQDLWFYNSPQDEIFDIGIGREENSFLNNADDKISVALPMPEQIDTSCPIEVYIYWQGTSATAGDIQWHTASGISKSGDSVTTTVGAAATTMASLSEQSVLESVAVDNDAQQQVSKLSFYIPDGISRYADGSSDIVCFVIAREGTATADDYPGAANIINIGARYSTWSLGGHI